MRDSAPGVVPEVARQDAVPLPSRRWMTVHPDEPISKATSPIAGHGLSPGEIVDEFEYNLTIVVTGTAKAVKHDVPMRMEPVRASGKGPTYVHAVNDAVHNLSRLLAKQEADSVG